MMLRQWLEEAVAELNAEYEQATDPDEAEWILEELDQIEAMLAGAPQEVEDVEPPF